MNVVEPKCTVFVKSTAVYRSVLSFHVHSPPTDSLRATSSPARSIHDKCPIQMCHFLCFFVYFLLYLFQVQICLDTQIILQLPPVFSTATRCTGLQPRSNRLYHRGWVRSRLYYPGLCQHSVMFAQQNHISQNVSPSLSGA